MIFKFINKTNRFFLVLYLLVLLLVFYPIFFQDKIHLIQNYNLPKNEFLLLFFRFLTSLAEGIFITLLVIYLATKKIKYALAVLFSVVFSGIFAQFFKRVIFSNHRRPYHYLKSSHDFNWMELNEKIELLSFPSGHTTTAFALFFVLIFISKNIKIKVILFITMFIVAYSRIYLYQHFHQDIFAGSILGTAFALLSIPILKSAHPSLQKSIIPNKFKK